MITSRTNPQVKAVRRLQAHRHARQDEQAFVVEGTRWLNELIRAGVPPRAVYATPAWVESAEGRAATAALATTVTLVDDQVMAAMSDTDSPPGVLAVVPIAPRPFPDQPTLVLVLDAVSNPGNLGTMLRTAAAAGVDGVLLGPGSVDPYNPKVVRGSMGALLRLPVLAADWSRIAWLVAGMTTLLAAARGDLDYTEVDWLDSVALIIGSEAKGAGWEAERLSMGEVMIPMHNETESLNAAVAAGIILFEAARQRRARSGA